MNKLSILLSALLLCCTSIRSQSAYTYSLKPATEKSISAGISPLTFKSPVESPLHEVRAVWLTTIGGLDWPHSYAQAGKAIEKQQKELCEILDKLQHAGINLVLIQTRVRGTTIFPSDMEPWDGCLSGIPGKSPGYDALDFAVKECHKRGMQLHAWVVTIPVGKWNGTGCKALRAKMPTVIKKIGEDGYMNPEMPQTGDYLAEFCADITRRYDIDGIHLDYIRYPETWGKIKDRNLGRRYITEIVTKINCSVKSLKPWVMLSCSPIGKYADLPRQWSHGWNARDIVCQDAASWMKNDLMDALFPMMYFRDNNFYPFAIDWQERSAGKIVAPGLGIYFMSPKEKNWPLRDITKELHVLRQYGMGHTYFRSKFFTDDTKGIYQYVTKEYCPYPALIPPMKWYKFQSPDAPSNLQAKASILTWTPGKDNSNGPYLRYNIYASNTYPVDTHDPRNIYAIATEKTSCPIEGKRYFAVTAIDRYGNESTPCQFPSSQNCTIQQSQSSECPTITCSNTLDINQINKTFEIKPSNSILAIETIQGNLIATLTASPTMSISNIPSGMYVVKLLAKKKVNHRICFLKVER